MTTSSRPGSLEPRVGDVALFQELMELSERCPATMVVVPHAPAIGGLALLLPWCHARGPMADLFVSYSSVDGLDAALRLI